MNTLFKNSIINIIFRICISISFGIILILISRAFGSEGKGIFTLLYFIPLLAFNLGNLGITNANIYYITQNKTIINKILYNSLIEGLCLGCIFMTIFFIIAQVCPQWLYGDLNNYYIWLALLAIPFMFLEKFTQSIFIGKQEFTFFNILTLLDKLLIIFILLLQIYIWKTPIQYILLTYTIITIILPIIFIIYLVLTQQNIWKFDWNLFKNRVYLGLRAFLTGLFGFLVIRSDIFLINALKTIGDVGLYSLAVNFTDEIMLIASSISLALFPYINERQEQSLETTLKTARLLSLFLIIVLSISIIFAKPVILYFFGTQFAGSLTSFYILAIAVYFLSLCTIISQFFASKGFPWNAVLIWLPGLIINVVLNLIFIPRFGIIAAALSSLFVYFLTFVFYFILLQSYQHIKIKEILIPSRQELILLKNKYLRIH